MTLFAVFLTLPAGCGSPGDSPLVVATTWPSSERSRIEAVVRESGDQRPIHWISLLPGEKLESVVDRRGGVDLLLGGPASSYDRVAKSGCLDPVGGSSWKVAHRPEANPVRPRLTPPDPRVDPGTLADARAVLLAEGWSKGYEGLVRSAAGRRPVAEGSPHPAPVECVALVRGEPNPKRATAVLRALELSQLVEPPPTNFLEAARADDLLADLLGAALVDALDELRQADAALIQFGHPEKAEAAIGERPPWPPASVAKLLADPNGAALVETLLGQIAPDPEARAWLVENWALPKRPIDGTLLAEIAHAAGGRLVLEPRFRAWLRGEWTAWTRQLYRRVARVAGGYIPS